jgi:K(+)-stimulated pyrophosphate-energized sodium pump
MEGTGKPEYAKCVDISTKAALREMMLPGILTIGFPIAVVLLGKLVYADNNQLIAEMLGGYMAGVTVSGVLWAVFQNNAGGAWDNAKKSFEAGVMINGEMTYKGSDAHKAAVTGDTVGDPFKDTSGPSMNILIKLTCLIGLVIAPILGEGSHTTINEPVKTETSSKEISIEKSNIDGKATATVITIIDGKEEVQNFEGTDAEVQAKIDALK